MDYLGEFLKSKKDIFRKRAIQKLKALTQRERRIYSYRINRYLEQLFIKLKPKSILFYMPLKFEPNVLPILKNLQKKKVEIFTPFIYGKTFKMVKFRLPLIKSSFGTFESGNSKREVQRVDIVIVPVIGIDANFKRVGFGKGMYDQFFPTLKNRPIIIFVQNIGIVAKTVITEQHDIRANYYITPYLSLKIKDLKTDANRSFNRANSIRFCHINC